MFADRMRAACIPSANGAISIGNKRRRHQPAHQGATGLGTACAQQPAEDVSCERGLSNRSKDNIMSIQGNSRAFFDVIDHIVHRRYEFRLLAYVVGGYLVMRDSDIIFSARARPGRKIRKK